MPIQLALEVILQNTVESPVESLFRIHWKHRSQFLEGTKDLLPKPPSLLRFRSKKWKNKLWTKRDLWPTHPATVEFIDWHYHLLFRLLWMQTFKKELNMLLSLIIGSTLFKSTEPIMPMILHMELEPSNMSPMQKRLLNYFKLWI